MHKFYLGQIGLGVIYLIFFWTYIPAIIGFIEGIVFLTMSDEDFDDKYNPKPATPSLSRQATTASSRRVMAKSTPTEASPRLDVQLLKICRDNHGATLSDCIIETEEDPEKVRKTLEMLCVKGLLQVSNRSSDGAVIYTVC